ncbi:unnamed protein product [Amoebophrya sp. A120]|nr:unnamed protein product [Amoebophrya sp. A120]|eukprot:GSA120T00014559001.1
MDTIGSTTSSAPHRNPHVKKHTKFTLKEMNFANSQRFLVRLLRRVQLIKKLLAVQLEGSDVRVVASSAAGAGPVEDEAAGPAVGQQQGRDEGAFSTQRTQHVVNHHDEDRAFLSDVAKMPSVRGSGLLDCPSLQEALWLTVKNDDVVAKIADMAKTGCGVVPAVKEMIDNGGFRILSQQNRAGGSGQQTPDETSRQEPVEAAPAQVEMMPRSTVVGRPTAAGADDRRRTADHGSRSSHSTSTRRRRSSSSRNGARPGRRSLQGDGEQREGEHQSSRTLSDSEGSRRGEQVETGRREESSARSSSRRSTRRGLSSSSQQADTNLLSFGSQASQGRSRRLFQNHSSNRESGFGHMFPCDSTDGMGLHFRHLHDEERGRREQRFRTSRSLTQREKDECEKSRKRITVENHLPALPDNWCDRVCSGPSCCPGIILKPSTAVDDAHAAAAGFAEMPTESDPQISLRQQCLAPCNDHPVNGEDSWCSSTDCPLACCLCACVTPLFEPGKYTSSNGENTFSWLNHWKYIERRDLYCLENEGQGRCSSSCCSSPNLGNKAVVSRMNTLEMGKVVYPHVDEREREQVLIRDVASRQTGNVDESLRSLAGRRRGFSRASRRGGRRARPPPSTEAGGGPRGRASSSQEMPPSTDSTTEALDLWPTPEQASRILQDPDAWSSAPTASISTVAPPASSAAHQGDERQYQESHDHATTRTAPAHDHQNGRRLLTNRQIDQLQPALLALTEELEALLTFQLTANSFRFRFLGDDVTGCAESLSCGNKKIFEKLCCVPESLSGVRYDASSKEVGEQGHQAGQDANFEKTLSELESEAIERAEQSSRCCGSRVPNCRHYCSEEVEGCGSRKLTHGPCTSACCDNINCACSSLCCARNHAPACYSYGLGTSHCKENWRFGCEAAEVCRLDLTCDKIVAEPALNTNCVACLFAGCVKDVAYTYLLNDILLRRGFLKKRVERRQVVFGNELTRGVWEEMVSELTVTQRHRHEARAEINRLGNIMFVGTEDPDSELLMDALGIVETLRARRASTTALEVQQERRPPQQQIMDEMRASGPRGEEERAEERRGNHGIVAASSSAEGVLLEVGVVPPGQEQVAEDHLLDQDRSLAQGMGLLSLDARDAGDDIDEQRSGRGAADHVDQDVVLAPTEERDMETTTSRATRGLRRTTTSRQAGRHQGVERGPRLPFQGDGFHLP